VTVTLSALEAGLTPLQVEKLRWETFGHKRALTLKSADQVAQFTSRRGFVLLVPHTGVRYPSVLEAAVGRPLLDFTWDERLVNLERWKAESLAARRLACAAVLAGEPTLLAPSYLGDFHALSGNQGDLLDHERQCAAGTLSADAAALCRALVESGPLGERELQERAGLVGAGRLARFQAALDEAHRKLLVLEAGNAAIGRGSAATRASRAASGASRAATGRAQGSASPGDPAVPTYDLLPRLFPTEVEKAMHGTPEAARQRIVCRYLRNVLVESAHEMARVLGWEAGATLEALQALVAKHAATVHPSSRPQRHLFQATATDLLQGEPAGDPTTTPARPAAKRKGSQPEEDTR
jgi:hypothetical protein